MPNISGSGFKEPLLTIRPIYNVGNTFVFIAASNPNYMSNASVTKTESAAFFFDASYSRSGLHNTLESVSASRKYLVLSHAHKDHYWGVLEDLAQFDAIFCGESMVHICRQAGLTSCKLDVLNKKQPKVEIAGMQILWYENCHTVCDLILLNTHDRVAFLGDMFIESRHPAIPAENLKNLYQSLLEIYHQQIDVFVPGHGLPVCRSAFYSYIEYLKYIISARDKGFSKEQILHWMTVHDCNHWKYKENFWQTCGLY